jgi:hypothetical protein
MNTHSPDPDFSKTRLTLELLEALLDGDRVPYPWNPADEGAQAYLSRLERAFEIETEGEELEARSRDFFASLDRCWQPASDWTPMEALRRALSDRFADRVPEPWIEAIARKAMTAAQSGSSLGDQLVACVDELLPHWAPTDLRVLARPLAYAMRSPDGIDSVVATVRPIAWGELSDIERARISLAIARVAIAEID